VYPFFEKFEGNCSQPLNERLAKVKEWCEIATWLDTNMIQVPSNTDPGDCGDESVIIANLRALADVGARCTPSICFAHEAIAWATHVEDWEESVRIVQLVDRRNFDSSVLTPTMSWHSCIRIPVWRLDCGRAAM
jgi:sugar phosphate isomerase/epimerase